MCETGGSIHQNRRHDKPKQVVTINRETQSANLEALERGRALKP